VDSTCLTTVLIPLAGQPPSASSDGLIPSSPCGDYDHSAVFDPCQVTPHPKTGEIELTKIDRSFDFLVA